MSATDDPKSKRISEEHRRRNHRARISLPIRVSSAHFVDDQVDEVRATINVSRGGLYFSTQRSSYHRGMKILLTIPFRNFVADAGPGERGEVVRVEHFKDGRTGVAVRLLKSTESRAEHRVHPPRAEETKGSPIPEHRLAPRLPFLTEAEVMEPPAGTWLKTSLSDLSLSGCYVDTLHPLPVGTVEQKRPDGLAELLFDSFLQPVLEGVRSSSIGTRQMLYRADPFQIDLLIEPRPGAGV